MERKERGRMVKEVGEKAEGELKELKQRLELEHELELDSYKQQLETGESDRHSAQVAELEETRRKEKEKEEELAELKAKTELFDVSCEEKIAEEKEKIVAILEAGFSERQRMALQDLEAKLAEEHRIQVESLASKKNEEMMSRLEELRQKMVDSSQTSTERLKAKLEKEFSARLVAKEEELLKQLEVEKQKFENVKQMEVEEVREKVRKKSKMEMESLRSRFKMMQTAGTLETRSPSLSESELSLEGESSLKRRIRSFSTSEHHRPKSTDPKSPRTDSHESLACLWEGERRGWEKEREMLVQQVAEVREELKDSKAAERLRSSAEKVHFNEAIRKAVEEKDRRIQELELSLSNQGRQRDGKEMLATMEERMAEVMRKNAQLESEVKEAQQRAARNMVTSFAPVTESETSELYRQLQEENSQLRAQLTKSMTSLINTGKVSVSSCSPGEVVLVLWSDEHTNYQIYHEGSVLHFLHTDSAISLGLAVPGAARKKQVTAEVVDKEYCQARKPENRFKVRVGTKFYRVKCRPLEREGEQ